jgi:hypothetical protein
VLTLSSIRRATLQRNQRKYQIHSGFSGLQPPWAHRTTSLSSELRDISTGY